MDAGQCDIVFMNSQASFTLRTVYKAARLTKKFAIAAAVIGGVAFVGSSVALVTGIAAPAAAVPVILGGAKALFWGACSYVSANVIKASSLSAVEEKHHGEKRPNFRRFFGNVYNEFRADYDRVTAPALRYS